MMAYLVTETEDFCTGAYYFGHNKYEFYFKNKDSAQLFYDDLKSESDNEVSLSLVNVQQTDDIKWMD